MRTAAAFVLALAQGALANGPAQQRAPLPAPRPSYANPGVGEGPLGSEDRDNFHP